MPLTIILSSLDDDPDVKALLSWNFTYLANNLMPTLFDLFFVENSTKEQGDEIIKNKIPIVLTLEEWHLLHLLDKTDPKSGSMSKQHLEVENASQIVNKSLGDALKKFTNLKFKIKSCGDNIMRLIFIISCASQHLVFRSEC